VAEGADIVATTEIIPSRANLVSLYLNHDRHRRRDRIKSLSLDIQACIHGINDSMCPVPEGSMFLKCNVIRY
jgi:hypothetical protein